MSSHSDADRASGRFAFSDLAVADEDAPNVEGIDIDEPTRDETLRTVFGLGSHDVRTYDELRESPRTTTKELADRLERDRSNVNRSLNRLREAGLATRRRRLLAAGGYVFQYVATTGAAYERVVSHAMDEWSAAALDAARSDADVRD